MGPIHLKTEAAVESRVESVGAEFLMSLGSNPALGRISSPYTAKGKSGVRHSFTLGAEKDGRTTLACDVVVGSAPVGETKVLSLFIKIYDIEAMNAVLCVVPTISEGARRLAGQYKISVLESTETGNVPGNLAALVSGMKGKQ